MTDRSIPEGNVNVESDIVPENVDLFPGVLPFEGAVVKKALLVTAGCAVAGAVVDRYLGVKAESALEGLSDKVLGVYEPNKSQLFREIFRASGLTALVALPARLIKDVDMGNANLWSKRDVVIDSFRRQPLRNTAYMALSGPAIEEVIARYIPDMAASTVAGEGSPKHVAGILSSVAFGLLHGTQDRANNRTMLPVPQMIQAAYMWRHVQNDRPLRALGLHVMVNSADSLANTLQGFGKENIEEVREFLAAEQKSQTHVLNGIRKSLGIKPVTN